MARLMDSVSLRRPNRRAKSGSEGGIARRFFVRFRPTLLSSSLPGSRSDKGLPSYSEGSSYSLYRGTHPSCSCSDECGYAVVTFLSDERPSVEHDSSGPLSLRRCSRNITPVLETRRQLPNSPGDIEPLLNGGRRAHGS